MAVVYEKEINFNCTIQELKHQGDEFVRRIIRKFQLHRGDFSLASYLVEE